MIIVHYFGFGFGFGTAPPGTLSVLLKMPFEDTLLHLLACPAGTQHTGGIKQFKTLSCTLYQMEPHSTTHQMLVYVCVDTQLR